MENEAEKLQDLLIRLEQANVISHPQSKIQATLCPNESCEVTIWFEVKSGLTIKKYRKFKSKMEKKFPWIKIKKIYNKHTIMLYYEYEKS